MVVYAREIELKMQRLYAMLSEKDRRRYAGIEAAKAAHGGAEHISRLFEIDPKIVRRGVIKLEPEDDPAPNRVRRTVRVGRIRGAIRQIREVAPGGFHR